MAKIQTALFKIFPERGDGGTLKQIIAGQRVCALLMRW